MLLCFSYFFFPSVKCVMHKDICFAMLEVSLFWAFDSKVGIIIDCHLKANAQEVYWLEKIGRVIRTSRHFLCCSHSLNVVIKDWKFIGIVWLFLVLRLQTVDYYWLSQRKEKTMANQNKINYHMSHWVIEAKPGKVRQPRVSIILHLIG